MSVCEVDSSPSSSPDSLTINTSNYSKVRLCLFGYLWHNLPSSFSWCHNEYEKICGNTRWACQYFFTFQVFIIIFHAVIIFLSGSSLTLCLQGSAVGLIIIRVQIITRISIWKMSHNSRQSIPYFTVAVYHCNGVKSAKNASGRGPFWGD